MPLSLDSLDTTLPTPTVAPAPQIVTSAPALATSDPTFDEMLSMLTAKGIAYEVREDSKYDDGRKIILSECSNKEHRREGKFCIFRRDAKWCGKCQSDDCQGYGFRDWFAAVFPECAEAPLAPDDELNLARVVLAKYSREGKPTIHYFRGDWYLWDGCWQILKDDHVQNLIYSTCKDYILRQPRVKSNKKQVTAPKLGKGVVSNVIMALQSLVTVSKPGWSDGRGGEWLAFANSVLSVDAWVDDELVHVPNTPDYFSPNALNYPLDYTEEEPTVFLKMLREQMSADEIAALQEFGGYSMTPQTAIQRILFIYGPTRSGKGSVGRTLVATIGDHNAASKSIADFNGAHALEDLPGKTLLSISDNRNDPNPKLSQQAVERLLGISGEDKQNINPKGKTPYTDQLRTKILLVSNEIPEFSDPSAALLARFLFVQTTVSKAGVEDPTLLGKILKEQNQITWWFLRGLRRLLQNGRYTEPVNAVREKFKRQTIPVPCFVNDCCEVTGKATDKLTRVELYDAFKWWCADHQLSELANNVFFRELYSTYPLVRNQKTNVSGIRLKPEQVEIAA